MVEATLYCVPLFHGLRIYVILGGVLLDLRASASFRRYSNRSRLKVNLVILHPHECTGLGPIERMVNMVAALLFRLAAQTRHEESITLRQRGDLGDAWWLCPSALEL